MKTNRFSYWKKVKYKNGFRGVHIENARILNIWHFDLSTFTKRVKCKYYFKLLRMIRIKKNKKRNSLLKLLYINRLRKRKRRLWLYEWLLDRKNKHAGASNLLKELEKEQPNEFINFVRMTPNQFHYLVNHIKLMIRKTNTI